MTHKFQTHVSMCHGNVSCKNSRPGVLSVVCIGGKNSLMIMEGSAVVEGESVLLQMLLLSESDNHLGKVSKHMAKVSAVPAQGQRGDQL